MSEKRRIFADGNRQFIFKIQLLLKESRDEKDPRRTQKEDVLPEGNDHSEEDVLAPKVIYATMPQHKISTRFYNDRLVRAAWDTERERRFFSVLDVVGAINEEDDYTKTRN